MLSIISMNRAGLSDGCLSVKVDFEFDNASTLPERVVTVSGMSYIIAKDSTAKNTVTNVNYKYNGSKWVKVTETVEPVTSGTITDNGDYTITSNEYTGLSDISVDVSGGGNISPSYITYGTFNGSMPPGSGTLDNRSADVIIVTPDDNGAVSYSAVNTVGTSTTLYFYAFVYGENVKRINLEAFQYNHSVTFKAGEDFEGFFYHNEPMLFEGTITAGTWYNALYSYNGVVVETNNDLGYVPMT